MNPSLARKDNMPDNQENEYVKGRIEDARIWQKRMKTAQTFFENALRDIMAFDEEHGTQYASDFTPVQPDNRKDPAPILASLIEKHGPMEKDELAKRAWLEGGGRGRDEAHQIGGCKAGIEQMINAKPPTLVRRKDGKIGLP